MEPIGIAGTGRLAQALGRLLCERGNPIIVSGRDLSRTLQAANFIGKGVLAVSLTELPARAHRILVAVPDDALPSADEALAAAPEAPRIALHTSGATGPEALPRLASRGVNCGTIHPLQTISTREQGAADLPDSYFGVTASGTALDWAREICESLNGKLLLIQADRRPLYHAAAVMASNYLVAILDAAAILMEESGVAREQALPALEPLIRASIQNSLTSGPLAALTGPIERGDEHTVRSHLQALRGQSEALQHLYRAAALYTLGIAQRKSPAVDRTGIARRLRESQLCDDKEGSTP